MLKQNTGGRRQNSVSSNPGSKAKADVAGDWGDLKDNFDRSKIRPRLQWLQELACPRRFGQPEGSKLALERPEAEGGIADIENLLAIRKAVESVGKLLGVEPLNHSREVAGLETH